MVEIKVPQNQVRVGEKRKNSLRRNGAVKRAVSAKKVHRSDPEGVEGDPKRHSGEKTSTENMSEDS